MLGRQVRADNRLAAAQVRSGRKLVKEHVAPTVACNWSMRDATTKLFELLLLLTAAQWKAWQPTINDAHNQVRAHQAVSDMQSLWVSTRMQRVQLQEVNKKAYVGYIVVGAQLMAALLIAWGLPRHCFSKKNANKLVSA